MDTKTYFSGKLHERMSEDLYLAGMGERTHDNYLRAVRKLGEFCRRAPDRITEPQLRKYFLFLKNECKFATGSLRVAYSGIKCFYTRTCRRDWKTLASMKIQNVKSLPEVLTFAQLHQIIDHCRHERMAVYFWTVYSLGLRLQEGLNLQVGDIDAGRGLVHIHRGEGAKDRYIPLPNATLLALRCYWSIHRHPQFLFPADGRDRQQMSVARTPMSMTAVQGAMKQITRRIQFGKKISTHTLRHSYATHLLGAGKETIRRRSSIQSSGSSGSFSAEPIGSAAATRHKTNPRHICHDISAADHP